jgi:hypothetical protein
VPLTSEGRRVAREIVEHLGAAHEPVREDVLHERIDGSVDPEHFVGVLEQLLAQGQVGVHVDRDPPVNRPRPARPFEARYWYLTPS